MTFCTLGREGELQSHFTLDRKLDEVRQTGRLPAAVRERSPRSHERAAEIEPRASPRARNELFLYIDLHTLNGDKLAKIIRCKP